MNLLRHNLLHALLAFGLLVAMVTVSHPERRLVAARQIARATQTAAAALHSLPGFNCVRQSSVRIDPPCAVRQAVNELLGSLAH